jgi:hypothetical protein
MMDWAKDSLEQVARTRQDRSMQVLPVLDDQESKGLLRKFHPDYKGLERKVKVGPDAGSRKFPQELADLLEANSLLPEGFALRVDIETDVLIIGGGGAGVSAALALNDSGSLKVHLATKLRLGDSNTVMAEGGIQSAITAEEIYCVIFASRDR